MPYVLQNGAFPCAEGFDAENVFFNAKTRGRKVFFRNTGAQRFF